MEKITKSPGEIQKIVLNALIVNGASPENASCVARALLAAEIDGQAGHGISRVSSYIDQLKCGKVDGTAIAEIDRPKPSFCRINAKGGFAYPAVDLLIKEIVPIVHEHGIAIGTIFNSHHFGQAGYHVERIAEQGLIALIFSNSPKAMAPWGGKKSVFGTNPIAFGSPRSNDPPLIIDLSLSVVARGKIQSALSRSSSIPEGWARDSNGQPTINPNEALKGTMEPVGGAKGAALALMVEILAAALTGGNFSFEASSFFDKENGPPSIGHSVIVIDPMAIAGPDFLARIEILLSEIGNQEGVRIPGSKRLRNRRYAEQHGLEIEKTLFEELSSFVTPQEP